MREFLLIFESQLLGLIDHSCFLLVSYFSVNGSLGLKTNNN